jgi:uncharacterized membrane protein YobD (UPF0266 family)
MGFLFIIFLGILCMILIARFASKTKPAIERVKSPEDIEHYNKSQKIDAVVQKGLITLLLQKNIITEEELLAAVEVEKTKKPY